MVKEITQVIEKNKKKTKKDVTDFKYGKKGHIMKKCRTGSLRF